MELYNKEFVYFDWDDKLEGKKGFFGDSINHLKLNVKDNRTMFYGEICHNVNTGTNFPFGFIDDSGSSHCFRFCYYDPFYEFRKAYLEGKQLQFKSRDGSWEDVWGEPLFKDDEYRIKSNMWYIILDDYGLSRTNSKHDDNVIFEGTEEECIQWMEKYKKFEEILLAWKQGKTIQYKDDGLNEWVDWMINAIPCDSAFDRWEEWRIKDEVESVPFDSVQELIDAWEKKSNVKFNHELSMPFIWIKEKEHNRKYLITDYYFEKSFNYDLSTSDKRMKLYELFEYYTFLDGSIIGKVKE